LPAQTLGHGGGTGTQAAAKPLTDPAAPPARALTERPQSLRKPSASPRATHHKPNHLGERLLRTAPPRGWGNAVDLRFAEQLGKAGRTQLRLTLALVCAVGGGGLPGELVEAGAAAIAGPAAGVVLAVALQPARERNELRPRPGRAGWAPAARPRCA